MGKHTASAQLQVALDFIDWDRAERAAKAAVAGGATILEAGTPLIKSEGLDVVRRLRKMFPKLTIVADMKTMDAGRIETECAGKAGADVMVVLAAASDVTLRECVEAGKTYSIRIAADLIGVEDPVGRARQLEEMGVAEIGVHTAIDEQMSPDAAAPDPFARLRQVRRAVSIPVAVAGGINSETAVQAVEAGADIVIVGGAITKAKDPKRATEVFLRALRTGKSVRTELYKRVTAENIREALEKVSTANLSDGSHHAPSISGLMPLLPGSKMVGPAVTVWTYPGDWAKPVEAIDEAEPGSVIVIDAGARTPAVWGELATHSAVQKRLAGVMIEGAIRDTSEIRAMKFPAFARMVASHAGEPKGLGHINVPVVIGGVNIEPGDWIVGDDDGIMVLPKARSVEMANRGMDCLERENRIRQEIEEGKTTLGQVTDLLRWEKK